jgi:hypothetical protein
VLPVIVSLFDRQPPAKSITHQEGHPPKASQKIRRKEIKSFERILKKLLISLPLDLL